MVGRLPTDSTQVKTHRTKPEHGEETRAKLIADARELFALRGYAGVALVDVCERAGVTRGALYHHFEGKDDLFRAVCEDLAGEVTARVVAEASGHVDAWSRLRAGCRAFLNSSAEPAVRQILLADAPSVLGWATFREIDGRNGLGLLKVTLAAAIEEGSVERAPVDPLAHVLVAALNEAALFIGQAEDAGHARQDAAMAVDRVLEGIAGARQRPAAI